jgi:hypothetical protein
MNQISLESAYEIAETHLNLEIRDRAVFPDTKFVIERDLTQSHDGFWVFFYQSDRYLATGEIRDALVGNLPIKVSKSGTFLGVHKT